MNEEDEILDSDDLEALKLQRLKLYQQKLNLVTRFGLLYYRPWEKQDLFHRAGNFKHRMLRAGNRSGKSTVGAAEDTSWLLSYRPWYREGDPARTIGIPQRPNKGIVITTDWDKVNEIWTSQEGEGGKIWKFLPQGFVKKTKRNHAGCIDTIECENQSILRFDTVESFKKNPQGGESSDWDFLHLDEPCSIEQYKANARGLIDRGGSDWFTLTPLQELWINDMFFPQDGKLAGNFWSVAATTYENPYLSAANIKDFEDLLTDDEKQCRLNGLPLELTGLIYKEFKREKHVLTSLPQGWKAWDQPPLDWTVYAAIDPHPKTPHAVLFIAVGPTELPIVYDEIFLHMSASDLADSVLHKLHGRNYVPVKCDPIAWIEDPETNKSMQTYFSIKGLPVLKASKAKEFGILNLKSVFKQDRGIRFVPTVTRTLWEINRYCYDQKSNKPVDADDHMMENLYRLFINPIVYQEPTISEPIGQLSLDEEFMSQVMGEERLPNFDL